MEELHWISLNSLKTPRPSSKMEPGEGQNVHFRNGVGVHEWEDINCNMEKYLSHRNTYPGFA